MYKKMLVSLAVLAGMASKDPNSINTSRYTGAPAASTSSLARPEVDADYSQPTARAAPKHSLEYKPVTQSTVDTTQADAAISALGMITRHGIDGTPVDATALRYGLETKLFDQTAIDAAQTKYVKTTALGALDMITRHGIDGTPVDATALRYGLETKLFAQNDVDAAQTKYVNSTAISALDMTTRHGIGSTLVDGTALRYGLATRLFDQKAVDAAQAKYEAAYLTK